MRGFWRVSIHQKPGWEHWNFYMWPAVPAAGPSLAKDADNRVTTSILTHKPTELFLETPRRTLRWALQKTGIPVSNLCAIISPMNRDKLVTMP